MPTIFILFGFRFMFYANDHEPIHVHVIKGDVSAKFTLFPVTLIKNNGLKSSELKLVESVIEENQEVIAEHWNKFFNKSKYVVMENIIVEKVWLTDTEVWIRTTDGKEACEKFSDFQRLKWATPAQRANFTTSHDGIHWRELDEDLSFEGFFRERKSNPLYDLFIAHPELNAAAIARRLGISQSLFAQYVSGTKKPSKKRFEDIIETIRSVGRELMAVPA